MESILLEDLEDGHPFYWDWGGYVLNLTGKIDVVATGNEYVKDDFIKHDIPVLWLPRYDDISGTKIRRLILLEDKLWEDLVSVETKAIVGSSKKFNIK